MSKVKEVDFKEIEALIHRVEYALEHDLALDADDMRMILSAIHTLLEVQTKLEDKDMTLHKLKKLLGMIKQSERRNGKGNRKSSKNNKKGSRRSSKSPTLIGTQRHTIIDLKKGDSCPACPKGKLQKKEPLEFIRVTGSTEYSSEKHILDRLECDLCDYVVTAEVPEEVAKDGDIGQKYGFSARSIMAIKKHFSGTPYFHQETLNDMFDHSIRASTLFDQCEYVSNDTTSAYYELLRQAANATLFHIDDTSNRILDQKPELKDKRNGKGKVERKGVYTSGLIASLSNGKVIYLYDTSLGHAGEMLDSILIKRKAGLPPPIIMCDALSRNVPNVEVNYILSYCNSHSRRHFFDLTEKFPEIEEVLNWYETIWINDSYCKDQGYDPNKRLFYHKEKSLPFMEKIKQWCQNYLDSSEAEEHSSLGKACTYYIKHYDKLIQFCNVAGVPIDNNSMEEGLKVPIRTRKNAHFYKTKSGADVASRLTSIICTAHRNGVNAFHYLNALQRYKSAVTESPSEWMPWTIRSEFLRK